MPPYRKFDMCAPADTKANHPRRWPGVLISVLVAGTVLTAVYFALR